MQIKNTNYQISQPNFQARYLSRSVSTAAKNRAESVIDIYSLNKNDKNFILGKEVDIIKLSNQTHPELYGNKFYIKDNNIDKYLKEFAVEIYEKRVKEIYNMFSESIPYPNIKIRKMSTRWGVCNKKNKTITLNLELIKKDIKYLDYVIVHELCHFIHFDHSKEFWNLVSKYCPNYKQLRKEMRDDN